MEAICIGALTKNPERRVMGRVLNEAMPLPLVLLLDVGIPAESSILLTFLAFFVTGWISCCCFSRTLLLRLDGIRVFLFAVLAEPWTFDLNLGVSGKNYSSEEVRKKKLTCRVTFITTPSQ